MTRTVQTFSLQPAGPFSLADQSRYFGGWPTLPNDPEAIVMAFPIEASERSAVVVLRQPEPALVAGEVHGCPPQIVDRVRDQALATLSLDVDGSGWPEVGARDRVIGDLQDRYGPIRPTLFHSPYEAAASFVIGHRISIKQARALRARIAEEHGSAISIDGRRYYAFPTPAQLLAVEALPSINQTKLERLRAVALAAQDGWLTRARLRALDHQDALAALRALPGVGAFFAQAIPYRGAGDADALGDDDITRFAVSEAYSGGTGTDETAVREIAERWRPYRNWAAVLLHVWARRELTLPSRRRRFARRACA
jgi:DNA-3-methyladenine glycosylase II